MHNKEEHQSDQSINHEINLQIETIVLLPAEKGGLRTGDVSESVCLSVAVLNFN